MTAIRTWTLEDFDIAQSIGSGQHSTVYLAREKSTKFICAIKMIPKDKILQSRTEEQVYYEIYCMLRIKFVFTSYISLSAFIFLAIRISYVSMTIFWMKNGCISSWSIAQRVNCFHLFKNIKDFMRP